MQLRARLKTGSLLLCMLLLSACRVVDLDENGKPIIPVDPAAVPNLHSTAPDKIAESLWQAKILPMADAQARSWSELQQLRGEPRDKPLSVFIRVAGKVSGLDSASREGKMNMVVDGETLGVQLGPIVKGNAIRDAATFIRFEDFKNQVQYAQLARALNKLALQGITPPDESWQGAQVQVLGAITLLDGQALSDMVPLSISRESQP